MKRAHSLTFSSPSLEKLEELLPKHPSILVEGLWDTPKALLLALLQRGTKESILLITSETKESRILDDSLYFGLKSVYDFPYSEMGNAEEVLPSPDIVGKRLDILHKLKTEEGPHLIVTSLQAALQKLPPPTLLQPHFHLWRKGETLSFSSLPALLTQLGYRRVPIVTDKGEFAVRGGLVDLFPLASPEPYRLDFFEDTLEEIRLFDPIGQKTTGKASFLFLCPGDERPFLDKSSSSLLDYLPTSCWIVFDDLLALEDKAISLQKIPSYLSFHALSFSALLKEGACRKTLYLPKESVEELSDVKIDQKTGRNYYSGKNPFQPLSFEFFGETIDTQRWRHPFLAVQGLLPNIGASSLTFHFLSPSAQDEKVFKEKLQQSGGIPLKSEFDEGYLSSGFAFTDTEIAIIPLTELTHRYAVRREKWRTSYPTPASDFHQLQSGDLIVHFHHGIGKFLGIEKQKNHLGEETEFLALEYAEKSRLFVPISQSYLVSRYIGAHEEIPTLHTLGTKHWQHTKQKAQVSILGYAQDLLKASAEREIKGGYSFPPDSSEMKLFEESFPYVETGDQLNAIATLKQDMESPQAMDRLLCGDVGYGKTEVAMRAAFKAAYDGKKQVAVLVPTTVLAMQHFETFSARMEGFALTIRCLSRFQSQKEIKKTLQDLASGHVDILIGTHRLLSKDVSFSSLGLLIIDEEQRFGVRAKEHLKNLKVGIDTLTLTATPIPRTLYFSLMGLRPISVINTPPQDRLPIKSFIAKKTPELLKNVLMRELARDGQAFFIHNRVETIFLVKDEIQKLLPEARIVVAHGQMNPEEIDTVFHLFKQGKADILVATSLIENGIDIPNANTILIDRAERFGLADLYQMRGRVGRWNRPAFAYFLTPFDKPLSEHSLKRLQALTETQGFGGGMKIAMRDLELRGAGDILGTQQSGQMAAIGFHLYCKLLKKAVSALQQKKEPTFTDLKMEFPFAASLPEEYIGEISIRLEIYHRLGEVSSLGEIDAILAELQDRFGPPPTPVLWLYHLTRIRFFAAQHKYTLLKFTKLSRNNINLHTERWKGKETVKENQTLPPISSPKTLEEAVLKWITAQCYGGKPLSHGALA